MEKGHGHCCCSSKSCGSSAEKKTDTAAYDLRTKAKVAQKGPYKVTVKKGETHYICTCGHSKKQPFCDGSHKAVNEAEGLSFKSMAYKAEEDKDVYFCGCKNSKTMPLCDGTHETL